MASFAELERHNHEYNDDAALAPIAMISNACAMTGVSSSGIAGGVD
ncbi:MAG TPA: hypothetical protein VJO53_04710 [Candidatus Acidoferrales bacterium]|nr:hypothetical protein [Candidatus Acidoferrales bacterium]